MPSVLVSVIVAGADAVGVLVGVDLTVVVGTRVGVSVAVGVSGPVGVTVTVLVIASVCRVVVNRPLHVTGLMLLGRPLAGTGKVKPVRNTLSVSVSGTVVSQRLLATSKLVVVRVIVGEKPIEAPGTVKL